MRKKNAMAIAAVTAVCAGSFALGAAADNIASRVQAELHPDYKVVVEGTQQTFRDAQGNTVYPLVYQNTTYLPVRSVGELMGKTVEWNEKTKTVSLFQASTPAGGTGTAKPDTGSTPSQDTTSAADVEALTKKVDAVETKINKLTRKDTAQYTGLKKELNALEDECDRLEDACKAQYRAGSMTRSEYTTRKNAIEVQDDRLDTLDDRMEITLGIDD